MLDSAEPDRCLMRHRLVIILICLFLACVVNAAPFHVYSPFLTGVGAMAAETGHIRHQRAGFYQCLEFLITRYGVDPSKWPTKRPGSWDAGFVKTYLKEVHNLDFKDVVFGRNMLGCGIKESRETVKSYRITGRTDAWGIPYDRILASTTESTGFMTILEGIGITQGLESFNKELTERTYVLLKADLHSQFGEVFKNFNGKSVHILAREINFLGCPGSLSPEYTQVIRPALASADCLRAFVYACNHDGVAGIPRSVGDLAGKIGIHNYKNLPGSEHKINVPVRKVILRGCGHDLEGYHAGMRFYGDTFLEIP